MLICRADDGFMIYETHKQEARQQAQSKHKMNALHDDNM
jgi:hypothetical protein